ncbi:MAG TPA: ATP-binding protein [Spirochaetota bacterium]|nr:ATP-binding protein [Spirochaetota bacterium]HOL56050.1 ATP-binding protein [Spirochaetota bacterium]HPP03196.1 ATP-binding protein [Spirochaetota bacterium]
MKENEYAKLIEIIIEYLHNILKGKEVDLIKINTDDTLIKNCIDSLNLFTENYKEATKLAYNLSNGDLSYEASRKNILEITSALKRLQSTLRHLTWKTQQIANGDFDQKISFIGEFSDAFNKMTEQLKYSFIKIEEQNRELKEAQNVLKEANATKDRFFSIIAHDLKNPFTSLIGFSKLAFDEFDKIDKEHLKEILDMIYQSSKNIYSLLENLLLWARSQSGNIKLEPEYIDLKGIIQENLDVFSNSIKQKRITIELNLIEESCVFVDYNTINTVIRNLLSNAIKFTNFDGKIEINTKKKDLDDMLVLEIKDNGLGILEDDKSKIFAIDKKISTLGTNKEKGSGLGLIICKEFVQKNNGKIYFESEYGKGTSFFVELPLKGSDDDNNKS